MDNPLLFKMMNTPEGMAEVFQCVPAVGAKLAVEKNISEVKLEAEQKMIGHFTLKEYI